MIEARDTAEAPLTAREVADLVGGRIEGDGDIQLRGLAPLDQATPLELGFLAPPIGLNLLLSSYRFNKPIVEVMRAVLPMLFVLLLGVLLITYFPPLTTWLPGLVK